MKKIITIFAVSLLFTTQAFSSSGGITGRTTTGCTCHGTLNAGNAAITISAAPDIFSGAGFAAGNTYTLTITVIGGPSGKARLAITFFTGMALVRTAERRLRAFTPIRSPSIT